jgi:antitoxin component YwqK of YwqJK toxin-antitoxin module
MYLRALIFLFFSSICNAQFSEYYLELTKSLKPVDTTDFVEKYKNGNLKTKGKYLVYNSEQYSTELAFGEFITYYKNGNIMEKTFYDSFGYEMKYKFYDVDGELIYERETILLDTSAKNINEFFFTKKHILFTDFVKEYNYSMKLCKQYLQKEGKLYKGKKIGTWKIYNPDGTLKKEKSY